MRSVVMGGVLLVLSAGTATADEVLEQIETATQYYEEGDYTGAISELQFAIEAIRARAGDLYAATFPEAPTGWTAGEVETVAAVPGLGGTMLSRVYEGPDGGEMTAELMLDSPMMQGFLMLLQNPAMLASQPDAERVRVHRQNAILTWPGDGTGELSLVLGGRALLRVDAYDISDKSVLVDLIEAWDVDALEDAAGL